MRFWVNVLTRSGSLLGILALGACGSQSAPDFSRSLTGSSVAVGNGQAATFLRLDPSGTPTAFGVALSSTALAGLPSDTHQEFILNLPPEAGGIPFTHVGLDWNPQGHEPAGIFDKPHFDVHFYLLTEAERQTLTPANPDFETKAACIPAAPLIPTGYVGTPGAVPLQGSHWIDPSAPEYNGQPFTRSFIYGFYDCKMAFLEPMITREFLLSNPDVSQPIALPQSYPKPGFYPTQYSVQFDAGNQSFAIVLDGLVNR